ncbi:hypothetical protein RYX36_018857 [Vicia faba]
MTNHQKAIAFLFYILVISLLPLKISASLRTEAEALVKWSLSPPLPSWLLTNHINLCNWDIIFCDNTNTTVSKINLSNPNSSGKLADLDFNSLPNLTLLDLNGNRFGGSIPSEYGSLSKLSFLDLGNNSLEGTLPSELGQLREL